MTRKADGQVQVRYIKDSCIGIVIEELKEINPNLSKTIRDYIMFIESYEVLKTKDYVSKQELKEICLKNLQFFLTQTEVARINLEKELNREKQSLNYQLQDTNLMEDLKEETIKVQEEKILKKSMTKNVSLLNSLLPQ